MKHLAIGLYIGVLILLTWYIWKKNRETFEGVVNDQAQCMKCIDYYRGVFQVTDVSQVVPYIANWTEYLVYILRQYQTYVQTMGEAGKCGDMKTLKGVRDCLTKFQAELVQKCKDAKISQAECVIISTLGDRIIEKALLCGAKQCTPTEFRDRFAKELGAVAQDLLACGKAFEKDTDACTQMYKTVILAKKNGAQPLNSVEDGNEDMPITRKEFKEKMGEMTAFVMNM